MTAISIIVPLYNKKKYLTKMLNSVLAQSFSDFELLIIDDGSTDGSELIADEYAERDSRIRVWHISNRGVSHARNVGLSLSKGEYITFVDADDSIDVRMVEHCRVLHDYSYSISAKHYLTYIS